MTLNIYKYRAIQEKMLREGMQAAEACINTKKPEYFGDGNVTKYRKHDGTFVYQMTEEVVHEILKFVIAVSESAETCNMLLNNPHVAKEYSQKQLAFFEFCAHLKMQPEYLNSIKNCVKGSPMLSFYRDSEERAELEKLEEKRKAIQDMWTY